jgi:hypothetical protein
MPDRLASPLNTPTYARQFDEIDKVSKESSVALANLAAAWLVSFMRRIRSPGNYIFRPPPATVSSDSCRLASRSHNVTTPGCTGRACASLSIFSGRCTRPEMAFRLDVHLAERRLTSSYRPDIRPWREPISLAWSFSYLHRIGDA